ncbi:hypothetical protein CR513_19477, partial [Mucuna pruriens]
MRKLEGRKVLRMRVFFELKKARDTALQYPNRRVMIVKDDGEVESDSSYGEKSSSSEAESLSDGSHYEGDLLVVRRCLILGNLCFMIIDGGSCVNVTSERLMKKLALPTFLSEKGKFLVKQAEVTFTLGGYEDKVTCNVVPMEATHLLLGRPWQFDKRVIHDGVTYRFIFVHFGKRVVLKPLSLREVHEDKKNENEKKG